MNSFSSASSILHRKDQVSLLISVLMDVQEVKCHLLDYLPWMIQRAKHSLVKKALLDSTTNIQSQLLKIQICLNMSLDLDHNPFLPAPLTVNFGPDLKVQLSNMNNYMSDYKLLSHVLLLENMELTSLISLLRLIKRIKNTELMRLLSSCTVDNRSGKKHLIKLIEQSLIISRQ